MKSIKFLTIIIITILFSCQKKKNDNYIIFSGAIENPIIDSLLIQNINNKKFDTIRLTNNNSFRDTLFVPKGYYYLNDRHNIIRLFLNPSFNLNSKISYKKNGVSLVFQGKGANENNYLRQKILFDKTFKEVESYKYFISLDEEGFLKLSDSIYAVKMNFLNDYQNLDEDFRLYESFSIENNRTSLLHRYFKWRGLFLKDNVFKVSDSFPNPYENIDISNEKLLTHPDYIRCLTEFISFKMESKKVEDKTLDMIETIDKEIMNQTVKDELVYSSMKFGIARTKKLDEVYNLFSSMVKNKLYKEEIEKIYLNYTKISKGTVSPIFELYDINNNLVTLESLKGKLVYIDIWATWCIPCVLEIPALKKLEKEFKNKNIEFVSICTSDTKENFEKMVKEKDMGGIQLFAPDDSISFFEDYFVSGIPRFILIDQDGKIIDANAYNPSDSKLKKQLLQYIQKRNEEQI